jgi:exodeoxyribonuclease VII small subunit
MSSSSDPPTFEQSLTRLQELVDQLEDGQLTLGQSLAAYEEGIKHLQVCHAALTETERKIEVLSGFNAAGEPITKPFDDTASDAEEHVARRSRETQQPAKRRARSVSDGSTPVADAPGSPPNSELDGRRELF